MLVSHIKKKKTLLTYATSVKNKGFRLRKCKLRIVGGYNKKKKH